MQHEQRLSDGTAPQFLVPTGITTQFSKPLETINSAPKISSGLLFIPMQNIAPSGTRKGSLKPYRLVAVDRLAVPMGPQTAMSWE
ncbi:MAG TPA: hypothetical protein DD662_02760 [Planctomycetaceae bacterium]|nr:hypothetical protein [Planctomycetaceae bacterium]